MWRTGRPIDRNDCDFSSFWDETKDRFCSRSSCIYRIQGEIIMVPFKVYSSKNRKFSHFLLLYFLRGFIPNQKSDFCSFWHKFWNQPFWDFHSIQYMLWNRLKPLKAWYILSNTWFKMILSSWNDRLWMHLERKNIQLWQRTF